MNQDEFCFKTAYLMSVALNPECGFTSTKQGNFADEYAAAEYYNTCKSLVCDNNFYDYCDSQGVGCIISCAMEDAYNSGYIKKSEFKKWDEGRSQLIYKNLKFEIERERIFSQFSEHGIHFMPLKGIVLNELYPAPGMRSSGDNDIFIEGSKETAVSMLMQRIGYSCEESGNSYHSIYSKKPFLVFEMHIALMKSGMEVSRKRAKAIKDYYLKIWERLVQDKDNPCSFSFTPEDFYIFHLVHAASHFNTSGMSLKFLADTYMLLKEYQNIYDWNYINEIMDKFTMRDFEDMMRNLSLKLFSPNSKTDLSEKEKTALDYIASGKTFGNHNKALDIQMSMIHQKTDSFYRLTKIEEKFSLPVKLKYLLLYFAQMCDEIEINLICTNKSTLLLPWVLIKKAIFKIKNHSDTVREFVSAK